MMKEIRAMLVNCYYYAPHNHEMLFSHIRADLDRMRELGCNAVSVCVQESQLENWHWRRLEDFITLAHRAGLEVHAVPNRWAGLFAGWLDGFGPFTVKNIDLLVEDENRRPLIQGEMACCINKPGTCEHVEKTLTLMLDRFAFDGVIWDEPHSYLCHCDYCRAKAIDTPAKANEAFAEKIDALSLRAKQLRRDLTVSLFVQPHESALFDALLQHTRHIDYLGSDGHLRSENHRMHRMKDTIFAAHNRYAEKLRRAGRKSLFLIEAQRHRDEDLPDYLRNLDAAFALPMDQMMFYYSAHELSCDLEEQFNLATWDAVKKAALHEMCAVSAGSR